MILKLKLTFPFNLAVAEVEEKVERRICRDQEVIRIHQNGKPLKYIISLIYVRDKLNWSTLL